MKQVTISLTVNGAPVSRTAPEDISLADFLHEKLKLTGTKVSCAMGICKACTVAVRQPDHKRLQRVQACITPAAALEGQEVTTVEGLSVNGALSSAQQALLENFSFQCGYCTPGFLMGITLLIDTLSAKPVPRQAIDQVIEEHLGQHICRCTGYANYRKAILKILDETPGIFT